LNQIKVDIHECLKFFLEKASVTNFEIFSEENTILQNLHDAGMLLDPRCKGHQCANCVESNIHLCSNFCAQFKEDQNIFRSCLADSRVDDINVNFLKLNVAHSLDEKNTNVNCNNSHALKCNRSTIQDDYFKLNNLDLNSDVETIVQNNQQQKEDITPQFRFKNVDKSAHRLD